MTVRAAPTQDMAFTDMVCESTLPPGATEASVGSLSVPVRRANIRRLAVLGDTGCKITRTKQQACDESLAWPFAQIAASVAAEHPDLILHVGDLLYRKTKCTTTGCMNSPFGITSAALQADFFTPAAPLLRVAPLLMTRGNHEDCAGDWIGWFRYFAFGPLPTTCPQFTAPFAVRLTARQQLVVMDTSAAKDKPTQQLVTEYTHELSLANQLANVPTWLVSHVPFWQIKRNGADGNDGGPPTLEQALHDLGRPLSSNVRMIISGDLHQFEYLSFDGTRPPQLILGDGGTRMSKPVKGSFAGQQVDGDTVSEGRAKSAFGYGVMSVAKSQPTTLTIETAAGSPWLNCKLSATQLHCIRGHARIHGSVARVIATR